MTTVLEKLTNKYEMELDDDFTINEFLFDVKWELSNIEESIDEAKDEEEIAILWEQYNDLYNNCKLYKGLLTYFEVKEINNYFVGKGIRCENIFAYVPLKKEFIGEIRDILIDNYAETLEECEEMEKMNTVKELRAFIKEHMGNDWTIYNGNFINAITSSS